MAAAAVRPPFVLGKKEIFLPRFRVILHRTNHLGPRYASFTVPLWFNKLDLRDYLYNVYNVRILSIRSYVKQQPVVLGESLHVYDEDYTKQQQGRRRRLKSIKRMTVELEQPFQWPDEPEDKSPWEGEHFKETQKEQEMYQARRGATSDTYVDKDRIRSIKEQAEALLAGKTRWTPVDPSTQGPYVGIR